GRRAAAPAPKPVSAPAAAPLTVVAPAPASGCGNHGAPKARPPEFPEVRVNGVEIEAAAIARELQHHPAGDPKEAWTAAARALVVRELLLHEARRRGIAPNPEEEGDARESEEEALVRLLLEEALDPAEPGEAECRRLYESQRERFRTPDLFEAAHILI